MKYALFLILSFIPFGFSSNPPSQTSRIVYDNEGEQIWAYRRYYISLIGSQFGRGAATLNKSGNSTCPLTIVQSTPKTASAMKVRIILSGINTGIVFTGNPIDIIFEDKPECATSSKWVVVVDDFPAKWVAIGDAQDHPGKQVINNGTFTIQNYDHPASYSSYKLVFCPYPFSRYLHPCSDVGIYDDGNTKRLVLTDGVPLGVHFARASA